MPGANCSIYGCSTSRKSKGIAIFKVPSGDDEYNKKWREELVNIITKNRVIDENLKKQIKAKTLHVCELHYQEEYLLRNDKKTTRIPGKLPTLNLPTKSFTTPKVDRSTESIEKRAAKLLEASSSSSQQKVTVDYCYKSISEFQTRVKKLKLPVGWEIKVNENFPCGICFNDNDYAVPKYQILVENDLSYRLFVYSWEIQSNQILIETEQSMKNVTLSNLISKVANASLCGGVKFKSEHIISHTVPKSPFQIASSSPLSEIKFSRPVNCLVLCEGTVCNVCHEKEQQHKKQEKIKLIKSTEPAKDKAPISSTNPERIKLKMQQYRLENKQLLNEMEKLQTLIKKLSVPTSKELDIDLKSIMSNADSSKLSPFIKFFWEEQQKYLKSSTNSVRYHPAVIRYCLSLHAKSSSFYEDIRYNEKTGTGFLILPSQRRLRDYKNYIRPKRGFNNEIVNELKRKTAEFSDSEKHFVLLLDEMKIQENLVWDKHTGELIGYVDLGDPDLNSVTLENVETVATHVLVFMLRSIVNPMKFSLATFATTGATSIQLFPLFWRAVGIIELTCCLKLMAVTCDGASPNRKFFSMHGKMVSETDINPNADVTYRIRNVYSRDRFIYFISDPPHLLKTARNCLSNSGAGRCTRFMWNSDGYVLWSHIQEMFYDDQNHHLHLLPKLTYDHVNLTSYSVMNVRMAAQVLSNTVSKVLAEYGPKEAASTSKFCAVIDKFFDIANIRNTKEHIHKSKPNLAPFASSDDERLTWLTGGFLQYFQQWLTSINSRPGEFTDTAKGKMFISLQTYKGFKITAHSIVDCVRYLLNHQICDYVLTEKFCQDPLENYFGYQRSMGARKDNPTLRDVGYNDNTIRNQKVFRTISSGNSSGAEKAIVDISNETLQCRKKIKLE